MSTILILAHYSPFQYRSTDCSENFWITVQIHDFISNIVLQFLQGSRLVGKNFIFEITPQEKIRAG